MTTNRILMTIADGIADVRLNRPAKRNALDMAMFEAIAAAIDDLGGRDDVRVVVLSGEGGAFCAGLDLSAIEDVARINLRERTHGAANLIQQAAWGWHILPMPVIAAVDGFALGGGLQIALGADIRIVAPDAKLAILEAKWGLVPDTAGTVLLDGLVRNDVLRELTYTARIVDGREAVALGLATRVADSPWESAMALARTIAAQSPPTIRADKRLLTVAGPEIEARLLAESIEQEALIATAVDRMRQARQPAQ